MPLLPKLKIKLPSGDPDEFVCDLEEARNYLNFSEGIFLVEGQGVHTYDELVQVATRDIYKDKEFIEVKFLQYIGGG